MKIQQRFIDVYKDAGRLKRAKAPALFVAHIMFMGALLPVMLLQVIYGSWSKFGLSAALFTIYSVSFAMGFRGKFDTSANTISIGGFFFLASAALSFPLDHPYAIYMSAIYLIIPTYLASVVTRKTIVPLVLGSLNIVILLSVFVFGVIPANPEISVGLLIARYLVSALLFLLFIVNFLVRSHRTTQTLLEEADNEAADALKKQETVLALLHEVKNHIQATKALAMSVQEMEGKIAQRNEAIETIQTSLESFLENYSDSSKRLDEISSQISSLNEVVYSQSSAQEQSAASTNNMVKSIERVNSVVLKKQETAEELSRSANTGGERLKNTVEQIQEISGNLDAIKNMVSIINNVASQTNLLSMNAAIEAAHAGESGRGFSVVAEEIRKLAENSSSNAKQISGVIKQIVANISVSQLSGSESLDAFQNLSQEVQETTSAFAEIQASTRELSEGSSEILSAITDLSKLTRQVKEGSQTIQESQQIIQSHLDKTGEGIGDISVHLAEIADGNSDLLNSIGDILNSVQGLGSLEEKITALQA